MLGKLLTQLNMGPLMNSRSSRMTTQLKARSRRKVLRLFSLLICAIVAIARVLQTLEVLVFVCDGVPSGKDARSDKTEIQ